MTCAHCADLEEELAYLRSELGLQVDATEMHALAKAFGLSPGPVYAMRLLYSAKGRAVTNAQIVEALPARDHDRNEQHIGCVYICRLRKALGYDAIETVWGRGYRLAPQGVTKVAAVLAATPARRFQRAAG